ncbi:MAG: transglycosylase domain-containing protein, partial [Chitinispirillaceae bacterium]|nr:transglycosylase domain-containing protein [Chitinispirillaceae bacterium]
MNREVNWSKILIICGISLGIILLGAFLVFFVGKIIFYNYFNKWGEKLVELEKRGLLSKTYGAGWQDVISEEAMNIAAASITERDNEEKAEESDSLKVVDGIVLTDYPSLSIINKLKEIRTYSNIIEITDRLNRPIVSIKTDHRRVRIDEIPEVLKTALIAAEDKNFMKNNMGFEYESFVRAILQSTIKSLISFKKVSPKGTSSITQQVAKLFLSKLDEQGFRRVSKSLDRKIRELRIATALRKMFPPEDILEVYCNHCVTSDYGMIGYADIAAGLFGKEISDLNDAECIYLARMVKWGRNVPSKIIRQCHIDMPRMGAALGWDKEKQKAVLSALDTIKFCKPTRFQGSPGLLVDLANEFWQLVLARNNIPKTQIEEMNLINPNSLIRKKGNLRIKLTIDLPLQKALEELVNKRGYGPDTTIIDDVRVGSRGETVNLNYKPLDTLRFMEILSEPIDFNEPGSAFITSLNAGDTVYKNIRYKKIGKNTYRRSLFFYVRKPVVVNGQYYAYAIMNSRTGKLLAYYSKDRIGSRLACLLKNRTPNGSSTIKPILNAINFDLGIFSPNSKWSDTLEIKEEVPWKRSFDYKNGKPVGVIFEYSAVKGVGYNVHNHDDIFEGCQYIFDLLSTSNNILGVETIYRLNKKLFTPEGDIPPDAFPLVQFFSRIGAFSRVKDSLKLNYVTGVRVIKELARIVGVNIDSITSVGSRIPLSDSMYSVALGALEMTLYEQLHLFNVLYNNDIIEKPAEHPSLVIESIILNGDTVPIGDTIRRYHPFS